jgi:hypothetical protein
MEQPMVQQSTHHSEAEGAVHAPIRNVFSRLGAGSLC